jgi:hypothetical protein
MLLFSRQRYQRKLKEAGHHCTLSDSRERLLTSIGFVWDARAASWQEHFQELKAFKDQHGHCNVSLNYHNVSLSVWVKHQRRQYRFYLKGYDSSMTEERIIWMNSIGFDWNPRNISSLG